MSPEIDTRSIPNTDCVRWTRTIDRPAHEPRPPARGRGLAGGGEAPGVAQKLSPKPSVKFSPSPEKPKSARKSAVRSRLTRTPTDPVARVDPGARQLAEAVGDRARV